MTSICSMDNNYTNYIIHNITINNTSYANITEAPSPFQFTTKQIYFLIVLVLAGTNVLLGLMYGCIQYRDVIWYHCCNHSVALARGRHVPVPYAKRPKRANLMMHSSNRGKISVHMKPSRL